MDQERPMSKVWLITGSSRGLGRALGDAVLAAGHKLVGTARNPAQLADLVKRYGDRVRAVALDVTDAAAAGNAVKAAVDAFGRLDFGVVNVTKAAIPLMREQRSGHIIQISSIGGRRGTPGLAAYQAAKWGVEGFSEVLAKEVGPLGIKVTIIEPGGFRTDWSGSSMTIRASRREYDATVGAVARFQREYSGTQPGDPAKAAAVIIHVASLGEPPLRLLLGSDAVHLAEETELARTESDRKWRELSVSTD